ncbi:adenine nucleotide translocase lysine N-methyltransferase-like [Hyperolius riggenbachi]|uniref:adenine nucleotide translocase lysine N-methyltransferase-like n=1 Tax=Hyperolius riggenbachi TaxID=752182 RepID=UPI0035A3D201
MEDNIETILFNKSTKYLFSDGTNSRMPWIAAGVTSGVYAVWSMFVLPGFRKIPWKLKVPYLPSGKTQTANVLKLLQGRKGQLADLGSGDGRLVFEAASLGFKSTGYEIHPILVNWAKATALWRGLPEDKAAFLKENFWTADLSTYNNVIVFLSPSVVDTLKKKLSAELPDDARVIVCRFPLSGWHPTFSEGHGLDQVWAYDMAKIKKNSSQDGNQQLL